MIGVSQLGVDRDGNIHIKDVEFPATKGLWELLTRKKVDNNSVTSADLKQYKTILKMTNAHLEGYKPHTSKGLGTLFRSYSQAAPDRAESKPHYVASG
jgi:hypothetical protein